MKKIILLLTMFSVSISFGQQKKLHAKSFINKKAPSFHAEEWLTDEPETKGKFVLIDFWTTWCGPCKKVIPELNRFHKKFKDDLVVIGLSNESKQEVEKMKIPKIKYYSAIDTKSRLKRAYKLRGYPYCVVVNPNGIVVWEGHPRLIGFELTKSVLKELIDEYKSSSN